MTTHERIEAALKARPDAIQGEWEVFELGYGSDVWEVRATEDDFIYKALTFGHDHDTAALIAAAPDLVDEVIRLRKWQSEAVGMLKNENLYLFKGSLSEKEYQINLDTIDRLIAEAQEDYVDGHKQC